VQLIDARDLGDWLVRCADQRVAGVHNAVGPAEPLTMRQLLETCRDATESDAHLRWVSADTLLEKDVEDYLLPLWTADPAWRAHGEVDNSRALAVGLAFRPLEQTVRDTLAWIRSGAELFVEQGRPKPGLSPEREAELVSV
jgi:2'-hydroxyisoflavone reductase